VTATAIGAYATAAAFKTLAGITDTSDDTLIGLICDRANQYLESQMHQVVAPISSATYVYDVSQHHRPRYVHTHGIAALQGTALGTGWLYLPTPEGAATEGIGGIRATTLVEIAPYTGADYVTVPSGDYFLRGRSGIIGPYQWLVMSDHPTGTYRAWPVGFATVRVTGTAGWAAIPDDLTNLALVLVQRAWNARQSGYQNVEGVDEQGKPIIARFLQLPDYQTLKRYTLEQRQVF
jgi:hypothetical protein